MVDDIEARLREVELEIGSRRAEHQIDPTLDRVAALVSLLGDPHRAFPVVHVTGTNGKTSTTRMTESLLRERGLRTGRFTSPHLVSMRERICVDGVPLSAERFVELYEEIRPYVHLVDQRQPAPLSFFEILTGMMFAAFADAPVDVAVIEVGMGGRWDATNVADGAVAVITPIAMDHMQWLGGTIEAIATEKSGIIKPGATAVIAQQPFTDAAEILLQRAALVGASVAREGFEFGVLSREVAIGGQQLVLQGLRGIYGDIFLPLFGGHQASNAACALAAVEAFAGVGQTDTAEQDEDGTYTLGVRLSDRGPRSRPGPGRVRRRELTGTPRHPAEVPDGDRGRRAQPGGHGGDARGADRELQLRAGDRRCRGPRRQGRRGHTRRARAGAVGHRGDHELLAARDARRPARRAGQGLLRRGPGARRRSGSTSAIDIAVSLADAATPSGRRGGRLPGLVRRARHRLRRDGGRRPAAARPGKRGRHERQRGLRQARGAAGIESRRHP